MESPAPFNATGPASRDITAVEFEGDHLTLTLDQAKLVDKFRQDVRLCRTKEEKFEKCIRKRDELLEEVDRMAFLLVSIERVMLEECPEYMQRKVDQRAGRRRLQKTMLQSGSGSLALPYADRMLYPNSSRL